jgi:DNA-binding response OmpR family regulator
MLDFMIFDTNAPRGRILVVDDDPVLRTMLVVSLAEAGHDVLQAEDGARALDLMLLDKSKNCLPDVLVTDIHMPRLDGIGLLERLAAENIRIPSLVMTAIGDKDTVVRLLRLGAEEFVDKPFDIADVCRRIESLLRRSQARKGHSGLEILFEGNLIRLDRDPNEVRRVLERVRDRVDTIEAEDKGRVQLPPSTDDLDLVWNSRHRHELSAKTIAHLSTPEQFVLLAAHPAGHDTFALQTAMMMRMIFSASASPRSGFGEEFLRSLGTLLYQQPKQPLVRAMVLRFDFATNSLEIASAGHPSPILVPHSSSPHSVLTEYGSELGPHPAPTIASKTVALDAFDRVLLVCPWMPLLTRIHAPTGAGLHLGIQGISDFAQSARSQPLHAMVETVWEKAMEFAHWNTAEDLFLLGLERKAPR